MYTLRFKYRDARFIQTLEDTATKNLVGEMKDLDARQQLLVILMEECGELIQEVF